MQNTLSCPTLNYWHLVWVVYAASSKAGRKVLVNAVSSGFCLCATFLENYIVLKSIGNVYLRLADYQHEGTRLFYSVSIRGLTSGYVLRYKTMDGGEKPEQKPPRDDNLSHFKAQCFLRKPTDAKDSGLARSVWLASPTALFVCIHGLSVIELCNLQQKQLDASHWNGSAAQTHGEAQCFENTGRARLLHKNSTDPGWEIGGDHRCGGT